MGAEATEVAAECSVQDDTQPPKESENMDLTITANMSNLTVDTESSENAEEIYKMGFGLNDLYALSIDYYKKGKEGLALNYFDKVQLVALWKQVTSGKYTQSKAPAVGYFDVIGNDRKKAWEALGDMAPDVAKQQFCDILEGNCPEYVTFVNDKRAELDAEIERKRLEEEEMIRQEEEERIRKEEEERLHKEEEERLRKEEEERLRLEEEERLRKEEERIRLEEEEKAKEAARLAAEAEAVAAAEAAAAAEAEAAAAAAAAAETAASEAKSSVEVAPVETDNATAEAIPVTEASETASEAVVDGIEAAAEAINEPETVVAKTSAGEDVSSTAEPVDGEEFESVEAESPSVQIAPASLWTRPRLQEFINHVKGDANSVMVVGRGETVTVRVPTHEKGSCLFWEFATDFYDIGFGVYFEWSTAANTSTEISVNVNESDNEEDSSVDLSGDNVNDNENEDEDSISSSDKPNIDEVLSVLRRNSHEQVIVGSHTYPGCGTYLLKFDNSYSLLRSKTLYYRVYYTK